MAAKYWSLYIDEALVARAKRVAKVLGYSLNRYLTMLVEKGVEQSERDEN